MYVTQTQCKNAANNCGIKNRTMAVSLESREGKTSERNFLIFPEVFLLGLISVVTKRREDQNNGGQDLSDTISLSESCNSTLI